MRLLGVHKDDDVLFTGRLGTEPRKMVIRFKGGEAYHLMIDISGSSRKPSVTFIGKKKFCTHNTEACNADIRINEACDAATRNIDT
ncbi:unnamed protein product [Dibothriocephalus latus]|uniref:Uncharacterized protein n=1 Tax=Dibothriocephalus latus TaxID=60516 RepID=A0A3P7NYG7_DIBLA|nr:unnamed protein product [Dibothriocephalus latus]